MRRDGEKNRGVCFHEAVKNRVEVECEMGDDAKIVSNGSCYSYITFRDSQWVW